MRNVFVSYSHRLDQIDADNFRVRFGDSQHPERMVFSDRSLQNQDLSHLSNDTIKNNYIRPKIRNSSVTIVLIGAETGGRWWVDWEIYYSMIKTADNDRNGVLGILLPYKEHSVPKRILMNDDFCDVVEMPETRQELEKLIEEAYVSRYNVDPDLSMPLRQRNS